MWDEGSVATIAGNGNKGFRNGKAMQASFNNPFGVAVDPSGQLLVTDLDNHCIRRIDLRGEISTFAGTAHRNGSPSQATFSEPRGLAVAEDGTVHVADCAKNRIWKITAQGEVSTVAGTHSACGECKDGPPLQACFYWPWGLALDGAGSILVADCWNHRIRCVTPQGVTTLAGKGEEGSKDGPSQEASFLRPRAVAVGPNGHLMVTDQNGRLCLIANGHVSTVATGLNAPCGLLVDCWGNAIVADSNNHRLVFCSSQGSVTVIAGNGQKGFKDGPSREASFNGPCGLALDHQGRVVVADHANQRVRALSLPSTKRLQLELAHLQARSSALPAGCSVTRSAKSLFKWVAVLQVAEGPFRGGLFEVSMEMAFDYPVSGPLVKFVPPLCHPNVDSVTGEVSYGEWATGNEGENHESGIVQVLHQVRELLEYPELHFEQVRNAEALRMWEHDRTRFDERAHEEARQSWLCKLKPNSDVNGMVCDLLCPTRKISREVQHEQFTAVAVPEIEEHVRQTSKQQTQQQQAVTLHVGKKKQHLKQKQHLDAKYMKEANEVEQAELKARLTKTLRSLLDLHNPRAAVSEWLERELARLCVAEARTHQRKQENNEEAREDKTGENKGEDKEGDERDGKDEKKEQEARDETEDEDDETEQANRAVQELLFQQEGLARPETSEQCFELLAAEAEREAKRLGEKMEDCMNKYELLYSRMDKVRRIEDVPAKANGAEVATPRQPLDATNRVLIAQAKRLESKLRRKYCGLVDTFNTGITDKRKGSKPQYQQHADSREEKNRMAEGEERGKQAQPLSLAEFVATHSTLCLSSGLRVQAKFGPGKSLSRLQQKGPPRAVLDYTRATVVFADPLLLALFFDLLASTFTVVRVTNKFLLVSSKHKQFDNNNNNKDKDEGENACLPQPPNVHVNFLFEGHVCEVQLMLEDFLWIKEFSHKPYEIVRLARDKKCNNRKKKANSPELREAVEHILAEGVYDPHPGHALYPPLLDSDLFYSQGE